MAADGETSNDRGWMYSGWKRGKSTDEWYENTKEFLDFAFSAQANVVQNGKIKCPCADCRNYITKDRYAVELDLCSFGFKRNYNVWTEHGEGRVHQTDHGGADVDDNDRMDDMMTDLAASNPLVGEEPIESAKAFYRMLDSVKELVHENTSHSTMSAIARLLTIKSMNNQSESAYNDTLQLIHELLPSNSSLPTNFYRSKKLLEGLGMPYHKIHVCRNNCMLYYKDNEAKLKCDFCKAPRYKEGSKKVAHKVLRYMPITDRLQRLYAHEETAKMMRYHKKTPHPDDDDDMMVHPCEAWQQLDKDEPNFASDPRSVRLVMARKQLKQMMYQARKDAVKKYCYEIDEPIKDSDACQKLLTRSQYIQGRLEWCKDAEAWESLCKYWCSEEYFKSRGLGKLSRTSSLDDVAQNRGGSRNFACTKEYIGKTFGPEQATTMNTYKCMKVGAKKYKENGSNTSIENLKAKKRLDATRRVLKVHIQKIGRSVILIPLYCTPPVVACLMDGFR